MSMKDKVNGAIAVALHDAAIQRRIHGFNRPGTFQTRFRDYEDFEDFNTALSAELSGNEVRYSDYLTVYSGGYSHTWAQVITQNHNEYIIQIEATCS